MTTNSTGQSRKRTAEERRKAAAAARAAQLRQEARRKRLALLGAAVFVLLLIGGVAAAVISQRGGGSDSEGQVVPTTPTGATTVQKAVDTATDDSGISGVLAWKTGNWPGTGTDVAGALEHQHVDGPVTYSVTPPVGGPHNGEWMNAGVYTKPIPSERAVHNLEHGAVWITYRPTLSAADVTALTALVAKQKPLPEQGQSVAAGQSNRYLDLSPWRDSSLPSPVVISAWGHQLRVDSAADPRLQKFIDVFRNNKKYAPEYGSAVDGIPVGIGGRADADGASIANPQ